MLIKITKGVVVSGENAAVGEVMDLPEGVSNYLIRTGKAIPQVQSAEIVEIDSNNSEVQPDNRVAVLPVRKIRRKPKK